MHRLTIVRFTSLDHASRLVFMEELWSTVMRKISGILRLTRRFKWRRKTAGSAPPAWLGDDVGLKHKPTRRSWHDYL
ncbi:hypothetical protein [Neomesorhizobium albiziae]|nr:hypothetical protein [Mesorhizobium albiziae]